MLGPLSYRVKVNQAQSMARSNQNNAKTAIKYNWHRAKFRTVAENGSKRVLRNHYQLDGNPREISNVNGNSLTIRQNNESAPRILYPNQSCWRNFQGEEHQISNERLK
jgi:hypothetical protein